MKDGVINTDVKKKDELPMPQETVDNMISKFQSAGDGKFVTPKELKELREKKKFRQNSSK
jgi:hypothetical protein